MHNSPDPSGGIIAVIILFYGFIILLSLASFVFWVVVSRVLLARGNVGCHPRVVVV